MIRTPYCLPILIGIAACAMPGVGQTSRPFKLASTAIQAYTEGNAVTFKNSGSGFSFSQLASDVEVISIQPEFLGIPFAQFAKGPTLPDDDPWAQQMRKLADDANATGKELLVQTLFARSNLVGNALSVNGQVQVDVTWAPSCPDLTESKYAAIPKAYLNYVLWVARTFTPKYFVIMLEPNLYYSLCGGDTPSWKLMVKLERDLYRTVKSEFPSMILFPSFNLEAIYGLGSYYLGDPTGFDQAHYNALLAMKRDRLGLVTFPQLVGDPYKLPIDYYTRILDRNPNEPRVVITEAGWNSETLKVFYAPTNACVPKYSEPSFLSAYLSFLLYSGYLGNFDVITWWSNRDEYPSGVIDRCYSVATQPDFPECNGEFWCNAVNAVRAYPPPGALPEFAEFALKAFGSMGLRTYDGTPKEVPLSTWQQFQQLPITDGWDLLDRLTAQQSLTQQQTTRRLPRRLRP